MPAPRARSKRYDPATTPSDEDVAESAAQRVLSWILAHIERADVKPGDLLPTEIEIAAAADAGRSSVREALTALKALGIVRARRKGGTRLMREPVLLGIREYLVDEYAQPGRYHDAVLFRAALERGLAPLVARSITAGEIARLRRMISDAAADESADLFAVETAFHTALTAAARNHLADLLAHVYQPMFAYGRAERGQPHPDRGFWLREHLGLIEALESRDVDAFLRLMDEHLAVYLEAKPAPKPATKPGR
ncbi:MAG TPA: FCD domain-containing protein [Planctomycetota bacterium]|nr:FCD domain-containing protein [Planctomycetota bacterium]